MITLGPLICIVLLSVQGEAVDETEWNQLTREVEARGDALSALISEADRQGVRTDYAAVSAQVISAFQLAAPHDRRHVERVRRIFQSFGYYAKCDPAAADKLAVEELKDCLAVADYAMTELRRQLDGSITLGTPPNFSKGVVRMGSGYYRLDGRIVFPSSLVWMAKNGLSEYTMQKYRKWIAAKYPTVSALNKAYGTSYAKLGEVTVDLPIDPGLRGGPVWFDWCRFNMDRVNNWFLFLKQQVQKHDPQKSPVTIKMLGHGLSNPMRDHGMDIEYLTRLQDIPGADLRAIPQGATLYGKHEEGLDPETGWVSRYAYDWVDQTMMLDFTKSLCPDKVFYDSEWHGFGAVGWRHYNLDRDYVRSALWLAFSHGMGAIKPWLWGRNADGSLQAGADHIGELSTQPVALDAFGRTIKELNANAEQVVSAVPRTRPFLLFYCEEAAIQSADYTRHLESTYEALKLLNLPVGFTTPTVVDRLNPSTRILVVPPTPFISNDNLAKLRAFQQSGGRVILLEAESSFLKNELGKNRPGHTDLKAFASIPMTGVMQMAVALDTALNPIMPARPIDVEIMDPRGVKAYGVILSQFVHPETGAISVLLNNVSKNPRVIRIKTSKERSGNLVDVLTQQQAQARFVLKPCGVRVLISTD